MGTFLSTFLVDSAELPELPDRVRSAGPVPLSSPSPVGDLAADSIVATKFMASLLHFVRTGARDPKDPTSCMVKTLLRPLTGSPGSAPVSPISGDGATRSMDCRRSVSVTIVPLCSPCLRESHLGNHQRALSGPDDFSPPPTLAILAAGGALALSGCSGGRGADSETTDARLLDYSGIAAMNVDMGESMSGLRFGRSVHLTVTLEPGYVIDDANALVDWLIRTGWSVNHDKINGGVMMTIRDAEGVPVARDYWRTAMNRFGLPDSATSEFKKANYEKRRNRRCTRTRA
ncbi:MULTISPECIES: hypothetical protein [unclassified Cryobacterium]|uniref:hypothetical protein n=1 Tax=unclassified Cryobacterium TaxID=2649013 RepID=UPI00106A9797|nr:MULTISPECIES: hypothetical protein [unclassified Cryobacterium]TFC52851.1 hypothetical protein E3O68_13215 [Cryobacterium sp. TMB3-1-2]TFC62208.1 hypothetical protein E3O60_02675 [Cryobacterium sp. TMB1-7]TFC70701.1 hypothetical protein E3T21_09830 [Cryobacterium sp. TMB3-15]TFC75427.1 hypothetical protein E3T22_12400 [Cryobacterium sp. TMB3-10]TFD37629.1 hypothetical protein E3T58_18620 [Cryobacterium sp. TMB3-12]